MGHTSAKVKNRYNEKAYDRFSLMLDKGDKEKIKTYAESKGLSINSYIKQLIKNDMGETEQGNSDEIVL